MRYHFDDCVLDPDRRELRRAGDPVEIEPQVFDLLEYLIRTRDRVASRDDLLQAVWNGRIVSESTLSSRINAARTAVGDDGTAQRLIRTLPRKGVRFIGEVLERPEQLSEPGLASPEPALAEAKPGAVSIAVLPFDAMSSGPEDAHFADGMAEEIITGLAQCSGLTVLARNSSFIYKGQPVDVRRIGAELGAGYVLEGSVRRSEARLRITAQLIDARSGAHLWADRFEGEANDAFALQDRITRSVVAVIEPTLLFAEAERVRRRPPQSLAAVDHYLHALSLISDYTSDSMAAALDSLGRALERDPAHAQAMAASACYRGLSLLQGWGPPSEAAPCRAMRLACDAITLAPNDPQVLWMAAFGVWVLARDGPRAQELFRRALSLNPHSEIATTLAGWVEAANGDPAAGRDLIERSRRANPKPPAPWIALTGMALTYVVEARYAEAVPWAEMAVAQNRRFAFALQMLAVALVRTGEIARARLIAREILSVEPHTTLAGIAGRLPPFAGRTLQTLVEALREAGLPD